MGSSRSLADLGFYSGSSFFLFANTIILAWQARGLMLETARPQRRLSAILAADIVGYTRLVGLDEEGTVRRWQVHQAEVVGPRIAKFRGRIVKSLGDGLLVEFGSAVDAVRSATEIQHAVSDAEAALDARTRIQLRIGINIGDVIIDGTDIQGDGVNIAARLQTEQASGTAKIDPLMAAFNAIAWMASNPASTQPSIFWL